MYELTSINELTSVNECCICLEENNEYILLECCNNNMIHSKCLFITFLHSSYIPFEKTMPCPLCRGLLDIKVYFSLNDIVKLFSSLDLLQRKLYLNKIQDIIEKFYVNSTVECIYPTLIDVDNTNATIKIISYSIYVTHYLIYTFILSFCILMTTLLLIYN